VDRLRVDKKRRKGTRGEGERRREGVELILCSIEWVGGGGAEKRSLGFVLRNQSLQRALDPIKLEDI